MSPRIKLLVLAFASTLGGLAGAATIVHDAGGDLVLNSSSRAVYTNMYGGVWSFMRSNAWNGERTLMPAVRSRLDRESGGTPRTDSLGSALVMERGPAKDANSSPCFAVNPTSIPDDNPNMRAAEFPLIQPGQMTCHPGNTTDEGNQCVVLRFKMPRDGEYALNVKAWHMNTGKAGVTLLVNGSPSDKGRVTSQGPADGTNITTNDFSLVAANYKAGDYVELAVDGDGTYKANAMGFKFEVVETVDEVVDAAEAFSSNLGASTPTNPFTTSVGSWEGDYAPGDVTTVSREPLVVGYERTSQGAGLKGLGYRAYAGAALALPWIVINDSDNYVTEVNGSGNPTFDRGRALAPHEMAFHPDSTKMACYRFVPEANGFYDLCVSMRDLSRVHTYTEGQQGVDVFLMQGGRVLAQRTVSVEGGASLPGVSSGETIYLPNMPVVANVPLEVVVDSRGHNAADMTALRFALIRRDNFDFESSAGLLANAALKANMKSAAPAASWTYNGATWKIGILNGGINGAFSTFTTRANARYNDHAEGFGNSVGSSPFVLVNLAERTLSGAADGLPDNILDIGCDAFITHPAASGHHPTAVRLEVPETGVYRATAWYKDVDAAGGSSYNHGAVGYVLANGRNSEGEIFQSEQTSADGNPKSSYACVEVRDLYLRAGEPLDFVVQERNAPNNDLTTVQAWAKKTGDGDRYVSFDIDGHADGQSAPMTYAGAGRIGFSGSAWSSLKVESGVASAASREYIKDSAGISVVTRLAFSRANGKIVATAANVAGSSDAGALLGDGVVSSGSNDAYAFTVSGLLPGETYSFWFYSRRQSDSDQPSSTVNGVFAVGVDSETSSRSWFKQSFGNYASLTAVADAEGCVSGTFVSAADESEACWCGLQVRGPGFLERAPGLMLIVR